MIIWMLTFIVGLGNFAHCVIGSCEVFAAVLNHQVAWAAYPQWFFPAVSGNICGGVVLVTILEYGQVMHGPMVEAAARKAEREEKS
jgi:formate/nitrite transporter FocA (FNT family)